jgi:hypothetical protein
MFGPGGRSDEERLALWRGRLGARLRAGRSQRIGPSACDLQSSRGSSRTAVLDQTPYIATPLLLSPTIC